MIVAAVVVCAGVVLWFVLARKHPEQAASHATGREPADESGRGVQPGDVVERPAGPDAEGRRVDTPESSRPVVRVPARTTAEMLDIIELVVNGQAREIAFDADIDC